MIDDEGEVRELTEEDFVWFVKSEDFGGFLAANAFLDRREEILRAAEDAGIPREAFLALAPSKPGFEERVAAAIRAFAKNARLAAE